MSPKHLYRKTLWLLGGGALLAFASGARATEEPEITAVVARTSDDYVRTKQSNGTYLPETYAFGEGGVWGGAQHDASIDKLKFLDVARTIARPLAAQNYFPARDPKQTNLLIMVYWGMTNGTGSTSGSVAYQNLQRSQPMTPPPPPPPQGRPVSSTAGADGVSAGAIDSLLVQVVMENHRRDKADAENAGLLGFDAEGVIGTDYGHNIQYTALRGHALDLVEEISENRYFVVLMAYDFPLMTQKKHKLLWETRFSIRQRGTNFDEQLAAMAQTAARYFGQDSHGVLRKPLPETHVNLGELKIIGVEPDKK
jgi:hypothetical protein